VHVHKIAKRSVGFLVPVSLSAWKNSAPTVQMFMKFYIWRYFEKSVGKIQVLLKPDRSNG
jgi:hypothetical protein